MALPATDSFTYSDGALQTVSGGAWALLAGRDALTVTSGALSANIYGENYWALDTPNNDQYSQITVATFDTCGPCVRMSTTAVTMYYFRPANATTASIRKAIDNTWSTVGSDYSGTFASGDIYKLSISGTTLTPSQNGTPLEVRTDSSIASGMLGIRGNGTTFRMDNWEGGNVAAGTVYENTISFAATGTIARSKTSIMAKALTIPSGAGHVPSKSGVMGNTLSMAAQTLVNNNVIIAMQLSILSEVIAGLALTKSLTIDSGVGFASGAGVSEGSNAGFVSGATMPASISHSPVAILAMEKLLSLDSSASFAVINNLTMQAVLSILTLASQAESKSAVIEKVLPLLSNILQGQALDLTVNKSLVLPVSSAQNLLSILDFSKELIMGCSSAQLLAVTRIISKAITIASISEKTIGANLIIDKSLLIPSLAGDLNSVVSLISKDVSFPSSSIISILSSLIYSKNLGLESLVDQQISNSMLSSLSAIFGSQTSELGTCTIEIAKGISLQVQSVMSFDRTSVLALSFSLGSDCGLSPSVISALQGAFILPASVSQSPSVVAELSSECSFNSSAEFLANLGNLFQEILSLASLPQLFPGASAVYGAGVSVQASSSLSPTGLLLLDKDVIFSSIVDMLNSYGGASYSSDIGYEGLAGLEASRVLVFDKSFDLNSISSLLLNSTIIFDSNLGLDLFVLQTPIGVMVLNKNVSLDSLIGLDLVLEKLVSSGVSFSAFNSLSLDKQLSILRTAEFVSSTQLNRSSQGEFNPSILESSISGMSAAGTGTINLQLLFSSILSMNVSSAIAILRVLEAVITILTQSKYAMFAASKPMIFESTARTLSFVSSPRRG
uniref:Uncharacterized protein n=1 Tax=viral metagenome TaxID=1070528 RepID=A0A6M3JVW3_9ZZZZ